MLDDVFLEGAAAALAPDGGALIVVTDNLAGPAAARGERAEIAVCAPRGRRRARSARRARAGRGALARAAAAACPSRPTRPGAATARRAARLTRAEGGSYFDAPRRALRRTARRRAPRATRRARGRRGRDGRRARGAATTDEEKARAGRRRGREGRRGRADGPAAVQAQAPEAPASPAEGKAYELRLYLRLGLGEDGPRGTRPCRALGYISPAVPWVCIHRNRIIWVLGQDGSGLVGATHVVVVGQSMESWSCESRPCTTARSVATVARIAPKLAQRRTPHKARSAANDTPPSRPWATSERARRRDEAEDRDVWNRDGPDSQKRVPCPSPRRREIPETPPPTRPDPRAAARRADQGASVGVAERKLAEERGKPHGVTPATQRGLPSGEQHDRGCRVKDLRRERKASVVLDSAPTARRARRGRVGRRRRARARRGAKRAARRDARDAARAAERRIARQEALYQSARTSVARRRLIRCAAARERDEGALVAECELAEERQPSRTAQRPRRSAGRRAASSTTGVSRQDLRENGKRPSPPDSPAAPPSATRARRRRRARARRGARHERTARRPRRSAGRRGRGARQGPCPTFARTESVRRGSAPAAPPSATRARRRRRRARACRGARASRTA